MRVGMIGLGAMGLPMARSILKAGFSLTVWARHAEQAEPLLSEGAEWAEAPKVLAGTSDVVVLSVTNSPDVEELVNGENGILSGFTAKHTGADKSDELRGIVLDMSTISPTVTRSLAHKAGEVGVVFLDAPVSGGTQGAEAGTLTIMVGGDEAGFERVKPLLEAVGKKVYHVGPSGSGEVIKLVNNVLVGVIAAATAEALVLGAKAGADVEMMAEVVGASAGASWQLANQFPLRAFSGSFKPGFMTDLLQKDLGLALDLGEENKSPLFFTALARQLYGEAQAAGFGRDDYTAVLKVLEGVAGVEVRAKPEV